MLKKYVLSVFVMTGLAACASQPMQSVSSNPIGMANPASVYCQQIGGQSVMQKDAAGNQQGLCKLPNGQLVDEWDLYRKAHQK